MGGIGHALSGLVHGIGGAVGRLPGVGQANSLVSQIPGVGQLGGFLGHADPLGRSLGLPMPGMGGGGPGGGGQFGGRGGFMGGALGGGPMGPRGIHPMLLQRMMMDPNFRQKWLARGQGAGGPPSGMTGWGGTYGRPMPGGPPGNMAGYAPTYRPMGGGPPGGLMY